MSLSREEMVKKLMWNSGGNGFGICSFTGTMMWASDRPSKNKPDLPSIVTLNGPPEKYTDEELTKLLAFSEEKTAAYDKIFSYRRGANLVILDKEEDGLWMRKRLSWERGVRSRSLDETIEKMLLN